MYDENLHIDCCRVWSTVLATGFMIFLFAFGGGGGGGGYIP